MTSAMRGNAAANRVHYSFSARIGKPDVVIRAPGRINLIGEHTDYTGGFALPGAIDRSLWIAGRRRADGMVRIFSLSLRRVYEAPLTAPTCKDGRWPHYLLGVIARLKAQGLEFGGFDLAYDGEIPNGSGLSSSTALACGMTMAVSSLYGLDLSQRAVARIAQDVEQEYVGTKCGPLDSQAIVYGQRNRVLFLDCGKLARMPVSFPSSSVGIVLCNSGVERFAAKDRYNVHRAQCDAAVYQLKKYGVRSLREATQRDIATYEEDLGDAVARRARYIVAENERVLRACAALQAGDIVEVGRLMSETHEGLRRDFQVSCREIDILVDAALDHPGVLGSRMMGSGFGGCTINLIQAEAVAGFTSYMDRVYRERLHRRADVYSCTLGTGLERVA